MKEPISSLNQGQKLKKCWKINTISISFSYSWKK